MPAPLRGVRTAIAWWRSDAAQDELHRATADFVESARRVARKTQMPTRDGVVAFFWNQILINAVAWTVGVFAAGLVKHFFEVRGFRNLWGLTASSTRSLVSADAYQTIMIVASYSAGLVMLILMRHLILRTIAELYALRLERAGGSPAADGAPAAHDRSGPPNADPKGRHAFGPTRPGSRGRAVSPGGRAPVDGLDLTAFELTDD